MTPVISEINMTRYKNRVVDKSKKVRVYRNLNRQGVTYSIMQAGLVVAHAQHIALVNCKFIVNRSGWERMCATGRKNVHAFVEGKLVSSCMGVLPQDRNSKLPEIKYDRRKGQFVHYLTRRHNTVTNADGVILNQDGMFGAYFG
jgi:hypothetical protein